MHARARLEHDPGRHDFAVLGVGHAGHGDLGDGGMPVQELLDLGRIDVFSAANDQLSAPADDPVVAVLATASQVARMQPAVRVDGPGGRLGVVVITGHHAMPADAQLARFAGRNLAASLRARPA